MDNERLNTTPAKDARSEVANVDACGPSVEERRRIALEGDTHGKNKWAILFTVLVMTFMSTLDSSIVNVALPVMQKALAVSLSDIQWVSTVYLVAICASMLIFGRLGDMFGKVWLFQAGVALFAIGSLLCGLSHAFAMLLVSRCVQGIGAAAAMANNMGIITESFPAKERGRALGLLASFVALGMMCGPVLGRRDRVVLAVGVYLPYQRACRRCMFCRGSQDATACASRPSWYQVRFAWCLRARARAGFAAVLDHLYGRGSLPQDRRHAAGRPAAHGVVCSH